MLVKVVRGRLNGDGALVHSGSIDPKELEIDPGMQQKREHITIQNMGVGLLVSGGFFAWGSSFRARGTRWGPALPYTHTHIITVAIFKITDIVPEYIEVACYQWFQFVMKNLTNVLLLASLMLSVLSGLLTAV